MEKLNIRVCDDDKAIVDAIEIYLKNEGYHVIKAYKDVYKRQHRRNGGSKQEFLEKLLDFDGIYVPKFYRVNYQDNGQIASFTPTHPKARKVIHKVIAKDLDQTFFPEKELVPLIEVIHDSCLLYTSRCV